MRVCRHCHVAVEITERYKLLVPHIEPIEESKCNGSWDHPDELASPTQILFIRRDRTMFVSDLHWLCKELADCVPTMREPDYMAAYVSDDFWGLVPIALDFLVNEGLPQDRVIVNLYADGKFLERGWYLRDHKLGGSE